MRRWQRTGPRAIGGGGPRQITGVAPRHQRHQLTRTPPTNAHRGTHRLGPEQTLDTGKGPGRPFVGGAGPTPQRQLTAGIGGDLLRDQPQMSNAPGQPVSQTKSRRSSQPAVELPPHPLPQRLRGQSTRCPRLIMTPPPSHHPRFTSVFDSGLHDGLDGNARARHPMGGESFTQLVGQPASHEGGGIDALQRRVTLHCHGQLWRCHPRPHDASINPAGQRPCQCTNRTETGQHIVGCQRSKIGQSVNTEAMKQTHHVDQRQTIDLTWMST